VNYFFCRNVTKPGKHRDSPNLILRVDARGNKSFAFRYAIDGTECTLGLGGYPAVSLAEARAKAIPLRKQLIDGIDLKAKRGRVRAESSVFARALPSLWSSP
jgi:Arm DNA-binding domain